MPRRVAPACGGGPAPQAGAAAPGPGEALQAAGREDEATPIREPSIALVEELGLEREAGITRSGAALGSTKLAFD